MRKLIAVLFLALCPLLAQSQSSRMEKAERISKVLGIDEALAEAQSSSVQAVKEQVAAMLDQMKKLGVPNERLDQLSPSIQRLAEVSVKYWDPKVAARIYAEGLVDELSDDELAEAEKYYSSPAGAKANRAIAESQQKMQQYIQDQSAKALEPEMARFLEEVKKIASQGRRK